MKNRIWDVLKAFGAFVVILLFLALVIVSVIAELFPTVIPGWIHTVLTVNGIVFAIIWLVVIFKEWYSQRNAKKAQKHNK